MKNTLWVSIISSVVLMAPAGIALAKKPDVSPKPQTPCDTQVKPTCEDGYWAICVPGKDWGWSCEKKITPAEQQAQLEKKSDKNVPLPGYPPKNMRQSANENTQVQPGDSRGVPAFLRWLFGMAPSTSVDDIRAEIKASSTVSTSSNGLGNFLKGIFDKIGGLFGGR